MSQSDVWEVLHERLALALVTPRLRDDARVRHIGDEAELVLLQSGQVIGLGPGEAAVVERLNGRTSILSLLHEGREGGTLNVTPVLSLIERLRSAGVLADEQTDLYRALVAYLGRVSHSSERGGARTGDAARAGAGAGVGAQAGRETAASDETSAVVERATNASDTGADENEDSGRPSGPWRARSETIAQRARFLRNVKLFTELDMFDVGALADAAHEEMWPTSSSIVSEGGRADRFFVVQSGTLLVERRADGEAAPPVAQLTSGDWFGEVALMNQSARTATVRVSDDVPAQLLSFDQGVFDRIIRPLIERGAQGADPFQRRREQLAKVPLFQAIAPEDLHTLARSMREARVQQGTVLFRQGDPADTFFVILDGAVGIIRDGRPIAKLRTGEFFGETALLFTDQRTATVAATEDTRLWVLDRASFETFLRDVMLQRRDLMPTVFSRLTSTDPV